MSRLNFISWFSQVCIMNDIDSYDGKNNKMPPGM